MIRTWRIAVHEYLLHVRKKRFLLGLLSVPLIVLVMLGLVFLVISLEMDNAPLGYVDQSGLLSDPVPPPAVEPPEKPVEIIAFADEASARAALDAGSIGGYYVLPPDYLQNGQLTLVAAAKVREVARSQFYEFLSVNLLEDEDPAVALRMLEGSQVTIATPDGSRSISGANWFNAILPLIGGIIFIVAMFSAGGYLMQAVVDEKENRTIEVLLTSVSSNQFMAGKILGDTAVGLTQILAWGGFVALGVAVGGIYAEFLRGIHISWQSALVFIFIMLPAFLMLSALMAAVGATVVEAREGQQLTGWLSIPIWIPYMFSFMLVENPNSPFSVVLSMLPFTAPLAMLIRDGVTIVPGWQMALSAVIQFACAAGAIWLAGRAFRLGMLRYGKRLKLRELFTRKTVRPTQIQP